MLSVSIQDILDANSAHLELSVVCCDDSLDHKVFIPRIQKPGLALVGDISKLHEGRLQVFGKSEMSYLARLSVEELTQIIQKICSVKLAAIVVTRSLEIPVPLLKECQKQKIPLLKTNLITSQFISQVTSFLEDRLTASQTMHGVMVDVFGVGILIMGKSGIGKSECALDLISRGHRLVSDDLVLIRKKERGKLLAEGDGIVKHHMEIRGVGIIDIRALFGISAIRDYKLVDIVVELVEWNPNYEYDRLGIDDHRYNILDVAVPYLKIPVSPGRNITTIVEVAARNTLLKAKGYHASKIFEDKLNQELLKNEIKNS